MADKVGVLFDLDGVLVDSEGEYSKFWGATARHFNVGGESFAADIKGTTLDEILMAFREEDRDSIVNDLHEFESRMEYPMIQGASQFIRQLIDSNIPFAIVTSSDDVKMSFLFRAHPELKDSLAALVTGSMVKHSKPHPEGYFKGASMIGIEIGDCYVFEDSIQGLQAGMSSGATVIALATTNSRERIKDKAHKIIDNFEGFGIDDMLRVKRD